MKNKIKTKAIYLFLGIYNIFDIHYVYPLIYLHILHNVNLKQGYMVDINKMEWFNNFE